MTGPDGQTVDQSVLGAEIATPTLYGRRRTIEERVAGALVPERLAHILRQAQLGETRDYLTLAMEMEERYLHYASQLQTRYLALDGIAPSVEVPDGVPKAIGDFVHEIVEDPEFGEMASMTSDGIGKGYAVPETMWEYERKRLRPVKYIFRDQRFFRLDRLTHTDIRLDVDGSFEGVELPAAKFIRHVPRIRAGVTSRAGLARPAAWAFMLQAFTLQDWAGFTEVYGIPMRLGRYNQNASDTDKRSLLNGLRMFANDGAAIIPEGASVEMFKVEGSHGSAVFGGLLEYVDASISKLVVGQTMTADSGSSEAQAKVHNEVRLDIIKADCRQRARTVNRDLIQWAVALNFGPQERYPTVQWPVAEPEDVVGLSDSLAKLIPLGLRVGQTEVRGKLGVGKPNGDDDVLTPPATPPPEPPPEQVPAPAPAASKPSALAARLQGPGTTCPCCGVSRLAYDRTAGSYGADDVFELVPTAFEGISKPLLEPLLEAIDKATNFEEALAAIEVASPDSKPLLERLATLMTISRGIGDAKD
ncbi:DUF935 domain-containing protein [Pleomorphomonas carboxyditropha]|nr:DUF935 domain-containing protein [Pleomorphomonas carboxyditropha]